MLEHHSLQMTYGSRENRSGSALLRGFTAERTGMLETIAGGVLRYGLVALLVLWGAMKFFEFEAEAIRPLIENHPLMSWMYPACGVRGASAVLGVMELFAA